MTASFSNLVVRSLEPADFDFVRDLAGRQQGFTVPSPYILWMHALAFPELCMVANDLTDHPLGYVLAIQPCSEPRSIFVWQLSVTRQGHRLGAGQALVDRLKRYMERTSITRILFTAIPESTHEKWAISLAKEILGAKPRRLAQIAEAACPAAKEFRYEILIETWGADK
jgi:hypothetical protein